MKIAPKSPQLLYSYLATEMLAPFFASFLIINCVFFLVKLIPFLNFVLDLQIGLGDFTRLFAYLFPNIFLYSIPMSAMLGVTIGFARLSSDSEILAFKASGISIYKILPPVILVTALIALFTSYFSIKLIPLSEIAMKQLTYQLLKEKVNKGIKPHLFTEALGDVVVYVDEIDKDTGNWKNVWVSDMRGVKNPIIIMSSTGWMKSDIKSMTVSIVLNNGSLHRSIDDSSQIVEFENYQINIPLKPPSGKATRVKQSDVLNMSELIEEADKIEEDNLHKRKLLIEYHKRLVLPAGCLLISLIGLPLGLQARPGKKAIGIQAALAIFILYYILFTVGRTTAEESNLSVALCMWGANSLFLILAVYWIFRVANERPLLPRSIIAVLDYSVVVIGRVLKILWLFILKKLGRDETVLVSDHIDSDIAVPLVIHGNPKVRQFHLPDCDQYSGRESSLKFKSIDVAIGAGFEPCAHCADLINIDSPTQGSCKEDA